MPIGLSVRGNGLGAVLAAASLARMGHRICEPLLAPPEGRGQAIVLNEKSLWMIGDLFGADILREIQSNGVEISHRKLRWGALPLQEIRERSVSVDVAHLAQRLVDTIEASGNVSELTISACGRNANTGDPSREMGAFIWDLPRLTSVEINWCATVSIRKSWIALIPTPTGPLRVRPKSSCPTQAP